MPAGRIRVALLLTLVLVSLCPRCVASLQGKDVVVIANRRVPEGVDLADYYMARRSIPAAHLITVETGSGESISREDYRRELEQPVLQALARLMATAPIRCLVLMYGIPLKVKPPELSPEDDTAVAELRAMLPPLRAYQDEAGDRADRQQTASTIQALKQKIDGLAKTHTRASVDSELALIFRGAYPLEGWLPNPYCLGLPSHKALPNGLDVLLVSRLDGPDPQTVRRVIDESLQAEAAGLSGNAYLDARWPRPQDENLSAYVFYDNAIHRAAELIAQGTSLKVTLDSRADLFQKDECPDAALYCGWYSLGKYVDAFDWRPGAVGFHIASGECATLKRPGVQVWCKRMIEEGVAATLGPVNEPYVEGFPLPDIFFGNLIAGRLSLAECYLVSQPHLSWQMVLIGDPLYRPFGALVPPETR